jgi:transglutaminase superfamily protein
MIGRIFRNLYFLTFLNGFLIATLFYFSMEAGYEKELFKAIQLNINSKVSPSETGDSLVVKVMHATHNLLSDRMMVFGNQNIEGIKAELHPASLDLMTAKGACGSYSVVLSRVLENYDIPIRIAQMYAKKRFAAHNVVEARTKNGWIVLDPLFDVYFVKPDGKSLASYNDVQHDWGYYSQQVPDNYNRLYKYEDVRYSNWSKIPVILPAAKKILDLILGKEKADTLSVRTLFLKTYDLYFYLVLIIFIPVFIFTIKRLIQTKIFPQPNTPLTFSNVRHYARMRLGQKHLESSVNP